MTLTTKQLTAAVLQLQADLTKLQQQTRGGPWVYAEDFGAKGDGSDATVAIQKAIDKAVNSEHAAGTVVLPAGDLTITGNLRFYREDERQHFVNIRGQGSTPTLLHWHGPDDGIVLEAFNWWNARMDDFNLNNGLYEADKSTRHRGSTVGLLVHAPPTDEGTGSSGITYTNLGASGFDVGYQLGGFGPVGAGTGCTSESAFINCTASSCTNGFAILGWNTTDIEFYLLQTLFCDIGVRTHGAGPVNVYGGSCTHNQTDFQLAGNSFSINGLRTEVTYKRFIEGGFTSLSLRDIQMQGDQIEDGLAIQVAGNLTIESSGISQGIMWYGGNLVMLNTGVGDTVPFRGNPAKGPDYQGGRYYLLGNRQLTDNGYADVGPFDDQMGFLIGTELRPQFYLSGTLPS